MLLWWCPLILSFGSFLIHGGKKHRVSSFELSSKLSPATAVGGIKSWWNFTILSTSSMPMSWVNHRNWGAFGFTS